MDKSDKTILVTFQTILGEHTLSLPTLPWITIFEDTVKDFSEFVLPMDMTQVSEDIREQMGVFKDHPLIGFYYDVTNDPTPDRAASIVSLGYHSNRGKLLHPVVTSLNPLKLQSRNVKFQVGNEKDCNPFTRFKRPLRRYGVNRVAFDNYVNLFKSMRDGQ